MKTYDWKYLLMVGALLNCGQPTDPTDPTDPNATRESIISSAKNLPEPGERPVTKVGEPGEVVDSFSKDRDWRCTTQKFSAAEAPKEFVTFEPNAATLWPGSLLQGATLGSGSPEPIAVKRAGGTVLMNLINTPSGAEVKSYQKRLTEMTQGNVIDAQNEILSHNVGSTPAAFDFESRRIDSTEELALAMRAKVSWLSGSVNAKFKFSSDKRYTRYLLKLTQRYYTMVYETPTSLEGIFAPEVTGAELRRYVGPDNPATYVSSVTYGRQFYVLFESTASAQELEAAISFVQKGVFVSARVDAEASYKKTQSETIVHAFAIGGGAQSALDSVLDASEGKLDGLRKFIVDGANVNGSNPGLPLSYEVRHVSDNKVAKVGVATEFTQKTCVPVVASEKEASLWLDATTIAPELMGTLVKTWKGRTEVQNDGTGEGGTLLPELLNGKPALYMKHHPSTGLWSYYDVNVASGAVVQRDYTVVGVMRIAGADLQADPQAPWWYRHGLFMQGNSDWTDYNLHLGFENGDSLVHGHYYRDLRTQTHPSESGDILTFRFSRAEGKATSQNGILRGADKNQTQALNGNTGSRIGWASIQPFLGVIGEVRVYPFAMSPIEQKTMECELGKKWGIGVLGCVDGKPDPALMRY